MCCCRRLPREMLAAVEGTRECFPKPEYTATGDVGRRYAAKRHHTTIIRAEVPGPPYALWYRGASISIAPQLLMYGPMLLKTLVQAFPLLLEVSQVYCFSSSLAREATEQLRSSSYCFSSFSSSLARYAIRAPRLPAHDPYFRISDSPYWPWCRAGHPPPQDHEKVRTRGAWTQTSHGHESGGESPPPSSAPPGERAPDSPRHGHPPGGAPRPFRVKQASCKPLYSFLGPYINSGGGPRPLCGPPPLEVLVN